jgi:hypothetical protein
VEALFYRPHLRWQRATRPEQDAIARDVLHEGLIPMVKMRKRAYDLRLTGGKPGVATDCEYVGFQMGEESG